MSSVTPSACCPADVGPAVLTVFGPDRLDVKWGADAVHLHPSRQREITTLYRLPAVLLRVINEVRGNREDR